MDLKDCVWLTGSPHTALWGEFCRRDCEMGKQNCRAESTVLEAVSVLDMLKSCFNLAFLLQNNQHKLTLSMKPDDKYSEKQMQLETEKLKQKVNSLSPEDKQQIYEKGQAW